jgi:uncharacterized protein (DUF934 family)
MPLIDNGRFVADAWVRLGESETPPAPARVILPLARLAGEGEGLVAAGHALGADIPNDADIAALASWLPRLALIAVAFPKSADGRGFSIAQRLRRAGFSGELRATGHVIADQYAAARSCGFDTVEISAAQGERQPEPHWTSGGRDSALAYQEGYHRRRSVLAARWGQ